LIIDSSPKTSQEFTSATAPLSPPRLFRSFWMGGFECATQINPFRQRLDMIAGVQHDVQAEHDYALLKTQGMRVARDGVRWHLIDRAGGSAYDWSSFEPMFSAAARQGIQVIWDICHYGWPDDLDIFSTAFVDRFARFSRALAQFVKDRSSEVPFYSPMNEISFLAWGASRNFIYPFADHRDMELKRQLVRAAIASCAAVLEVDPRARFLFPEPTIQAFPPRDRPELAARARQAHESQFEAWDMIAGYQDPALGGHPRYLDILGANYYFENQWEIEGNGKLRWDDGPRDRRWVPLNRLLGDIYRRYRRPLIVAETSHIGTGRGIWIREISEQVLQARQEGTPVDGICLYPIVDRYDWLDPNHWHNSGLWDFHHEASGKLVRVLNPAYAAALRECQQTLARSGCI
jgi:hypothetical protein